MTKNRERQMTGVYEVPSRKEKGLSTTSILILDVGREGIKGIGEHGP